MSTVHNGNRRDFLKQSLSGAAFLCAGGVLAAAEPVAAGPKSRVVVAHDELLRGTGSTVDSQRMQALVDRAVQALFDRDHPVEAWRKLVRPGGTVSLKVNTLGGRGISTNVQLVAAICERLQQAGVKPADITIWDRDSAELERAGFHLAVGGNRVQCYGTDRVGYEQELSLQQARCTCRPVPGMKGHMWGIKYSPVEARMIVQAQANVVLIELTSASEHRVACPGVIVPAGVGLQIHGGKLPDLARVVDAALQTTGLLLGADLEPVLQART